MIRLLTFHWMGERRRYILGVNEIGIMKFARLIRVVKRADTDFTNLVKRAALQCKLNCQSPISLWLVMFGSRKIPKSCGGRACEAETHQSKDGR